MSENDAVKQEALTKALTETYTKAYKKGYSDGYVDGVTWCKDRIKKRLNLGGDKGDEKSKN